MVDFLDFGAGDIVHRPPHLGLRTGTGTVLRVDNMGVFVEWAGGATYSLPHELELVNEGEVTRLRRLIQLLHPDPAPDPITARLIQDEVGDRDFRMFCDVVASPHLGHVTSWRAPSDALDADSSRHIGPKESKD